MQALLEMGLDIFSVDDDRHTALLVAVQERCIPCVVLALEAAKGYRLCLFTALIFLVYFLGKFNIEIIKLMIIVAFFISNEFCFSFLSCLAFIFFYICYYNPFRNFI